MSTSDCRFLAGTAWYCCVCHDCYLYWTISQWPMSASPQRYFSLLLTRAITQALMIDSRAVLSWRGARCEIWSGAPSVWSRSGGWGWVVSPLVHSRSHSGGGGPKDSPDRQCATSALSDHCKYVSTENEREFAYIVAFWFIHKKIKPQVSQHKGGHFYLFTESNLHLKSIYTATNLTRTTAEP